MNYYKISITSKIEQQDLIIAVLSHNGFDGFEEDEYGIKTYIKEKEFNANHFEGLAKQFDFNYKKKLIPDQNWNAIWEANFQPIQINSFCTIRADFHTPLPNVTHEIVINPKMAFGTGHHETTHMMMEMMETIDFQNKKVFDFGCGTGILAILANKLGSENILAIDIDPLSYENTLENIAINKSRGITTKSGEINLVSEDEFDIILANINRTVILNTLPILHTKTIAGGFTLLSGILNTDEVLVKEHINQTGFSIIDIKSKGEWLCIKLQK